MASSSEDLPEEFDFIILGTGMVECILAAALSRVGNSVLHIDRNEHYGGCYASFSLQTYKRWCDQEAHVDIPLCDLANVILGENEKLLDCQSNQHSLFRNISSTYHVRSMASSHHSTGVEPSVVQEQRRDNQEHHDESQPIDDSVNSQSANLMEITEDVNSRVAGNDVNETDNLSTVSSSAQPIRDTEWFRESIEREWRRFNLDLAPRLLYCRGELVELLISSDVAKYCEFKTVDQIVTVINGCLQSVPCSRADVFSSDVPIVEKRMLMRFMQFCSGLDLSQPNEEISSGLFSEFLKTKNLSENIQHYISNAIAMATSETSTLDGLKSTQKFLQSLGRYGNTAFLWPIYGSGELPQCFARFCAVFGGTYCLRTNLAAMILDSNNRYVASILSNGQKIKSRYLIVEYGYLPDCYQNRNLTPRYISRAIVMVDRSLDGSDRQNIKLLNLPCPDDSTRPVKVLQLSAPTHACPPGMYIVHLSRVSGERWQDDFSYASKLLFHTEGEMDDKPVILWLSYFQMMDSRCATLESDKPENVVVVEGAGAEFDFDDCVSKAECIFRELCPGEEFLPRAPNPEDIIYDFGQEGVGEGLINGPVGDGSISDELNERGDEPEQIPQNDNNSGHVAQSSSSHMAQSSSGHMAQSSSSHMVQNDPDTRSSENTDVCDEPMRDNHSIDR